MKTSKVMFTRIIALTTVLGLFAGYAAARPIGDTALGAGGACLDHELSDGNPITIAAGAAGRVLLGEGMPCPAEKEIQQAYVNRCCKTVKHL